MGFIIQSSKRFLNKKYYTGLYIGAIMDTYARASIVINPILFLNTIIILYTTSVQEHLPWLSFSLYIIIWVISVLFLLLFVLKIAIPSNYGWHNVQTWEAQDNPMRDIILKNHDDLQLIKRHLGIMED